MGVKNLKCPNCGGDLQLDDSFKKGFCIFCGSPVSIESDNPAIDETIAKINEERTKKLETFKQTADYDGMFAECQSILSTDSQSGIAYAYAGFAVAHGANRMAELSKECYVGQMTTPNPMNIALPDLNNPYLKLQDSVAVYASKAIASDDVAAINVVFDLIDEIANDFANSQSKKGVYLKNGMVDCQNAIALNISSLQDYIAMKLADFIKVVLSEKEKAVNNADLVSQRIKQATDLFEQSIANPSNAKFVPVISAVIMGMKFNYFNVQKAEAPNLANNQSDFINQLLHDAESKKQANMHSAGVAAIDNREKAMSQADGSQKTVVKEQKESKGKKKKANYFTNFAKNFKQAPMIYICLVVLAVGFILLCDSVHLGFLAVVVPIAWIIMLVSSIVTYNRSVCSKCKSSLEYGDYSYEAIGSESKRRSSSDPNKHATMSYYTIYQFTRFCPNCGTEKVFRKKFLTATEDLVTGEVKENAIDLDAQATPGKAFTKKDVIGLNILGSVLSVIGIVMLVVGIIISSGMKVNLGTPKGTDPCDYYGTYEYYENNSYLSITLDNDGKCYYRNGSSANEYDYEYVSSEWACKHVNNYEDTNYSDKDAILVYNDSSNHDTFLVFYVIHEDNAKYKFVSKTGYTLVSTTTNGRGESEDPGNYYYKYSFDSYNSIKFNSNGTCYLTNGGSTDTYEYEYVECEYVKRYLSNPKYKTRDIIIVRLGNNRFYTFYVMSTSTLVDSSGNYFYR